MRSHKAQWRTAQAAVIFAALVGVFMIAATSNPEPSLSHVNVAIVSGDPAGNYYAVVARLAAEVQRRHGRVRNIASAGSMENIAQLDASRASCDAQFALVQDGLPWPQGASFLLVARLPNPESFIILGRDADRIHSVSDLRGLRVGIGPVGSGTNHVAREILAELAELDIVTSSQSMQEQLAMLARGDLDLGAMIIDPDAALISKAVRELKLQIVDFGVAAALAHRLPSAREGLIKAGHYDPVRGLPSRDKRVIEVDPLLIGNGCARGSSTQGLITALARVYPGLVSLNRERANLTTLAYAQAAQSYYDNQGPDRIGEYVPWLIDIMPTARWLQLIFVFSTLFAAQALWHRYRLWRLDARRVSIESGLQSLFGQGAVPDEVAAMVPEPRHRTAAAREELDRLIADFELVAQRCRRQSESVLVPMGQEMFYRFQEGLIGRWLAALRTFRARLED